MQVETLLKMDSLFGVCRKKGKKSNFVENILLRTSSKTLSTLRLIKMLASSEWNLKKLAEKLNAKFLWLFKNFFYGAFKECFFFNLSLIPIS